MGIGVGIGIGMGVGRRSTSQRRPQELLTVWAAGSETVVSAARRRARTRATALESIGAIGVPRANKARTGKNAGGIDDLDGARGYVCRWLGGREGCRGASWPVKTTCRLTGANHQ